MSPRLTRRRFLAISGIGLLLAFLAVFIFRRWVVDTWRRTQRALSPKLDRNSPLGELKHSEMQTIVALAATLIPGDESPGAEESWVQFYVNGKTSRVAGYLAEFEAGARLLDELSAEHTSSPKRFAQLSLTERESLLQEHFSAGWMGRQWLELPGPSDGGKRKAHFSRFVMRDILAAFYATSAGWSVVGYTNYPGVAGGTHEYTEPVSIVPQAGLFTSGR